MEKLTKEEISGHLREIDERAMNIGRKAKVLASLLLCGSLTFGELNDELDELYTTQAKQLVSVIQDLKTRVYYTMKEDLNEDDR